MRLARRHHPQQHTATLFEIERAETNMKIVKRILLALVVLAILIVLIGFLLPRKYNVERSIVMNATPSAIFPLVNGTTNWPQWSIWNQRDPNMTLTYSGSGGGVGAKWSWKSKSEGNGEIEFTEVEPERKIVYRLTFSDFGSTSVGVMTFAVVDEKSTKVTWTNDGDLGNNPLFRFFGLVMDGMVGKDFDASLVRLKALVEKSAAATAAPAPAATSAVSAAPTAEAAPAVAKDATPPTAGTTASTTATPTAETPKKP
jgi:uncharacterized protein YndB with AHSA1/START domain